MFSLLALVAILATLTPTPGRIPTTEPDALSSLFPDVDERRRYQATLHRLSMRPITPARLAQRAGLTHRAAQVRAALRADPRFRRVREPGPERYQLLARHKHAAQLAEMRA